ncbi:endonuclease NucS domain-containing protein [Streptomyces sp. NPDC003635]
MPLEFGLWRVDGAEPVRVTAPGMPLESKLEELIEAEPGILGRPLLLIGRQVPTDHGKFVDLLGLDAEGGLHVLELKRDRTPREVVAQVLDYGSWVQHLTNEQVREIYATYARRRGLPEELDEVFAREFGGSPPETLNGAHTLTVVAGEVDAATERIVTYLASGYEVPINVLFFRYFEDEGRSYLARTWLIEDAEPAAPVGGSKGQREPWNGTDWYVSFGDDDSGDRSWEDAVRYGFVSAGGGDWFSRTLRSLPLGARVFTHIPKSGYVGVGTVSGEPHPFEEAVVSVDGAPRRLAELPVKGRYGGSGSQEGADLREWVVPVSWQRTLPRREAFWRAGLFANQNSACKLRARFTIEEVSRHFEVE